MHMHMHTHMQTLNIYVSKGATIRFHKQPGKPILKKINSTLFETKSNSLTEL